MSACLRVELALLAVAALTACTRGPGARVPNDDAGAAAVDAAEVFGFTFAEAGPSDAPDASVPLRQPDLAAFLAAAPLAGKSIGHTSVVFKVELSGARFAAYKPESRTGRGRFRGEIAAYRLAQALSLPNVPPAVPRAFNAKALRGAFASNAPALARYDAEVVAHAGLVDGALIPWIPKLDFLPIETDVYRARWSRWLSHDGDLPSDQAALAAQISSLVVFDAVTGNWDRWSGGNVGFDKASGTLLFIDNDGAFFDPPPASQLAAQFALLQKIDRYSRKLVLSLRALTAVALADAIGELGPGVPLLRAKTLAGVDERRRRVLALIDVKISEQGEGSVLRFE